MAYDRQDIDRVRASTNLLDLVGAVTTIKRQGRSYKAVCPFHQEKTASLSLDPARGLFHCLAGETGVITWSGVFPIEKLVGGQHRLLTTGGRWVDAEVRAFGQQELWAIRLSRNGLGKEIHCTDGHRWLVRRSDHGKKRTVERTTVELRPGDSLAYAIPNAGGLAGTTPAPFGVAHGIVFGDGTRGAYESRVELHGSKNEQLIRFFPETQQRHYRGIQIGRLPFFFKEFPSLNEAPGYLLGFLAGYVAADGCVAEDGQVSLASASPRNLEFVRTLANRLGIGTYGLKTQSRLGLGEVPTNLYQLTFINSTLRPDFFVLSQHRTRFEAAQRRGRQERVGWVVNSVEPTDRFEEVFCAVVPGTHAFALDDHILTGNCFGCQASGDVFDFVRQIQGLDFNEAVELLAGRAGIPLRLDKEAARRRGERENLVEAVAEAVEFYKKRLTQGFDAGTARSYLRGRGYDAAVIEEFGIGFAPRVETWDALVSHLRSAGIKEKTMLEAGLASRNRAGRLRDYFYSRVVFPIYDLRGDPVGFGGRKLEGEGPKYLNSPETRLYQKAKLLYGLNWAKGDIARSGRAIVVEGYTDVIAMHRAGLTEAVATCGTALGEDHFDLLRRFAEKVVLAFDADSAGAAAALRGDELETPVRLDLDLRMAEMPVGKDPADLVAAGEDELVRAAVDEARPLLQFRLEKELSRFDLEEPEGRAKALHRTSDLVARVGDDLTRNEYARFLSRRTGVDFDIVRGAVEKAAGRARPKRISPRREGRPLSGTELAERELLRVVLANEQALEVGVDDFVRPDHREAMARLLPLRERTAPGEPLPLESAGDDQVGRLLRELALDSRPTAEPAELIARVQRAALETRIAELGARLASLQPEDDEYSLVFRRLIALQHERRRLGVE